MKKKTISAIIALALCTLVVSCVHANKKMNPPAETPKENDALMEAAKNSDFAEARRLIESGADVDARDNDGITPLISAAQINAAATARLLIEAGADVSAKGKDGKTALMRAEERDAAEVIALLKAAGAETEEAEN